MFKIRLFLFLLNILRDGIDLGCSLVVDCRLIFQFVVFFLLAEADWMLIRSSAFAVEPCAISELLW